MLLMRSMTLGLLALVGCAELGDPEAESNTAERQLAGATITANWQFANIANNGTVTPTACPSGVNTIEVHNQRLDSAGNPVGTPFIDIFDCSAGGGAATDLPPAVYETFLEAVSTNGTTFASSLSALVDVTVVDRDFNANLLNNGGYFQAAWILRRQGQPVSCSGIDGVEILSTLTTSSDLFVDTFDCQAGFGVTAGLPAGPYTISVDAFDETGALTEPLTRNSSIQTRNRVTDLGTLTLTFP